MSLPEEISLDEWKKRYPSFNYHTAIQALSSLQKEDRLDLFLYLSALARSYVPNNLTKFYSLLGFDDEAHMDQKKLSTLEREKIYLSAPKDLNDPFDCGCAFYDFENRHNAANYNKIVEQNMSLLPSQIRICSFTACGVQSMPMWAHYSNNHKGFCVEYDKTLEQNELLRSLVYPIQYSETRSDISDLMDEQIRLSFARVLQPQGYVRAGIEAQPLAQITSMLYNVKHSSWSFEQEYRLSVASNTPGLPELMVKPSKIFIGLNCPQIYSDRLKEIGKVLDVPVYTMKYYERSKSFNLVADQVK